jgi:hypothetical protein
MMRVMAKPTIDSLGLLLQYYRVWPGEGDDGGNDNGNG